MRVGVGWLQLLKPSFQRLVHHHSPPWLFRPKNSETVRCQLTILGLVRASGDAPRGRNGIISSFQSCRLTLAPFFCPPPPHGQIITSLILTARIKMFWKIEAHDDVANTHTHMLTEPRKWQGQIGLFFRVCLQPV